MPPVAAFAFPWDDRDTPRSRCRAEPCSRGARRHVRRAVGRNHVCVHVRRDRVAQLLHARRRRDASKGVADYRMLVRKLPAALFAERRTFAHDLFGRRQDVEGYLDALDWAIGVQLDELGANGEFEAFALSRRLGHRTHRSRAGIGPGRADRRADRRFRGARRGRSVRAPRRMTADHHAEEAALARVEQAVAALLGRQAIAQRASSTGIRVSMGRRRRPGGGCGRRCRAAPRSRP